MTQEHPITPSTERLRRYLHVARLVDWISFIAGFALAVALHCGALQ